MTAPSIQTRVDNECLRLLSQQAVATMTISTIVALGLIYLMWGQVPHQNVYYWCIAFLAVTVVRAALFCVYFRFEKWLPHAAWRTILEAGVFAAGITWGLSAVWLFPTGSLIHQMFLACLMMGLAAGASSSLSAILRVFVLFLLPTMLPIIVRVFLESVPIMHVGAIMVLIYSVGMISIAYNNQILIRESLTLRFKNQELALDLEALARHDALTGLANRLILTERLSIALKRADRGVHDIALMFIDCDHFKEINDTHGHGFGDEYLKKVAQTLSSAVRDVDTVARLGGDEFIVLLEKCGDKASVAGVGDRIFGILRQDYVIESVVVHPQLSVGISCYPGDGTDAETLLRQADEAMYHVKQNGGNTYGFYLDPADQEKERAG